MAWSYVEIPDSGTGYLGAGVASSDELYLGSYRVTVDHADSTQTALLFELQRILAPDVELIDSATIPVAQYEGRTIHAVDDHRFVAYLRDAGQLTMKFLVGDVSTGQLVFTGPYDVAGMRYGGMSFVPVSPTRAVAWVRSNHGGTVKWFGDWYELDTSSDTFTVISSTTLWTGRSSQDFSMSLYGADNGHVALLSNDYQRTPRWQVEVRAPDGTVTFQRAEDVGNWGYYGYPQGSGTIVVGKAGAQTSEPSRLEAWRWAVSPLGQLTETLIASVPDGNGWPGWASIFPFGGQMLYGYWDGTGDGHVAIVTDDDWASREVLELPAEEDPGNFNDAFPVAGLAIWMSFNDPATHYLYYAPVDSGYRGARRRFW